MMLTPPSSNPPSSPPPTGGIDGELRSHAVFVLDVLRPIADAWQRDIAFWYDGEEYPYSIHGLNFPTQEDARRKLYAPPVNAQLYGAFLVAVQLDTSRPH